MTANKIFVVSILALMGSRPALLARAAAAEPLTLRQCIDLALSGNPLLLSARDRHEASLARVRQARELSPPTLSYDSDLQPGPFNLRGTRETYLGLSQTLEFPGRRVLRGRIAARESDQVLADIDSLTLDLIFQVKQAFSGLVLAGERIGYAEQDLELARDFLDKTDAKFKSGDTAEVEVLRARVEESKAANGVRVARTEQRLAAAELNFLMARNAGEPLEILADPNRPAPLPDPEILKETALAARPEMRRVRAAEEGEALKKTQARLSLWPDLDLGLARHRIEGEADSWDFTLSVALPLFFWQPARGPVAEAEAAGRAVGQEASHLRNLIRREVEEAALNAISAREQIELFESRILQPAEEVYNAFLYRFQKGDIGGLELIEARRSLMEARKSYADARLNYLVTIALLERSIGRSLEGVVDEK